MAMRIPRTDYEMDRVDPGTTEAEFHSRKSLREGINGCDRFDSRCENTERTQVLAPRGDMRGRPMPRDARFRQANNHNEWGPDVYRKPFEYGMDGPNNTEVYGGLGLPSRDDIPSNANPQLGGAATGMSAAEDNPQSQGVFSKTP
jgi:hypothetical protein